MAFLVLCVVIGGVIIDENIRKVVAATAVSVVMFQVLARIGAWRWSRWDESERSVARRRSEVPFRRRTIWLEFLLLGAVVTAAGLAIGIGRINLLGTSGIALAVLLGAFVISDVGGRKPAAVGAPARTTGRGGVGSPRSEPVTPEPG